MKGLFSSVESRLVAIVGSGIAVLLVVASIAVFQLKQNIDEYNVLLTSSVEHEREISGLNLLYKTQVQEWKNVLLRGKDADKYQKYWGEFSKLQTEIQTRGASLLGKLPADDSKKLLGDFLQAHAAAFPKYELGASAYRTADFDPAAGDKAVSGIDREPSKMLSNCAIFINKKANDTNEEIGTHSNNVAFWSQLLVAGFGVAVIALVLVTLKKNLVAPLLAISHHIETLAQGRINTRLRLSQDGELGELNRNLDRMQDSLIAVIAAVKRLRIPHNLFRETPPRVTTPPTK